MSKYNAHYFYNRGLKLLKENHKTTWKVSSDSRRRFFSAFGTSPTVCSIIWTFLEPTVNRWASPDHLLWSLFFLKVYPTEAIGSSTVGVHEKTFRKWVWFFVEAISYLETDIVSIFTNDLLK